MKKLSEEELQKLLEQGLTENKFNSISEEDKQEFQVYHHLFEILKKEPETGPSYSFSRKVTSALRAEIKSKSMKKFYASLGLISFIGVVGIIGVMLFLDIMYKTELIQMVLAEKWIFIFCMMCLFLIQLADQKMLQKKLEN